MFSRRRSFTVFIIFALVLTLHFLQARAWSAQGLPVPAGTEEVKSRRQMVVGSEFDFTYYVTTQGPEQIKDFYRDALPRLGWREENPVEQLKEIPGFKVEPSLSKFMGKNLLFKKGSLTLNLNFLPVTGDGQTRFSVGVGEVKPHSNLSKGQDFIPRILDKPQKDVAPTYPGASLINLSEKEDSLRAMYLSKDPIENVVWFYKTKMFNYGWILTDEKPVKNIDYAKLAKEGVLRDCPTCVEKAEIATGYKPKGMLMGELVFTNAQGASCKIGLFRLLLNGEAEALVDYTNIMVDYAEKK